MDGAPTFQEQQERLTTYYDGFHAVYLMHAGLRAGLFAHLARHPQGLTPDELAAGLGLHPPYVRIWCQTAYAYRLLEPDGDGRFHLPPHYDKLLGDPESPSGFRSPIFAVETLSREMEQYPHYLKTGERYSAAHRAPALVEVLLTARPAERVAAPQFVELVVPRVPGLAQRLRDGGSILDVGCGPGVLLLALAKAFPSARVQGVDVLEACVERARKEIASAGLAQRVTADRMSAAELPFDGRFDVAVMTIVLHEVFDEQRPAAFARIHQALRPGGVLCIHDFAYPGALHEFRDPALRLGVRDQYLEMSRGHVHPTPERTRTLLQQAGFTGVERFTPDKTPGYYWAIARR